MQTYYHILSVNDNINWSNLYIHLTTQTNNNLHAVINATVETAQQWEAPLSASGGKLELDKCFYYLINWKFDQEGWPTLKPSLEMKDFQVTIQDSITKKDQLIQQWDSCVPHQTLGIVESSTLTNEGKLDWVHKKITDLTHVLGQTKVAPGETRIYYNAIYSKTVGYSPFVYNLAYQEWTKFEWVIICRLFNDITCASSAPRATTFADKEEGGMGFCDRFGIQRSNHIVQIVIALQMDHNSLSTFAITLSWFQHFSGMPWCILSCLHHVHDYIPNPWFHILLGFMTEPEVLSKGKTPATYQSKLDKMTHALWKQLLLSHTN